MTASTAPAAAETAMWTAAHLSAEGFGKARECAAAIAQWHRGAYNSTRSSSARARLGILTPRLIARAAAAPHPEELLLGFDGIVRQLPVGTHLFVTLCADPSALTTLLRLVGTAPRLMALVARHPEVFEALVADTTDADRLSFPDLLAVVSEIARGAASHEQAMERIHAFVRMQRFLVGARMLMGRIPVGHVAEILSRLTAAVVQVVVRLRETEFQRLHGRVAGGRWALLALGKFGGRELTATSDLDMMFLYDIVDETERSDGPQPLAAGQYFGRLAQSVIAGLGFRTGDGALFDTDFRLRPWGNKGPIATRLTALSAYFDTEAWTWEHMALTRARVVAGQATFAGAIEAAVGAVVHRRREADVLRADALEMRRMILTQKATKNAWDVKNVRGGLVDIEFIAQTLLLQHAARQPDIVSPGTAEALRNLFLADLLSEADFATLGAAFALQSNLMQVTRMACVETAAHGALPPALSDALPGLVGLPDADALDAQLREAQAAVRRVFERLIGKTSR